MPTCPECGSSFTEFATACECGHERVKTDGGAAPASGGETLADDESSADDGDISTGDGENPTEAYVRKMRERPYRERLAIRAGFRDPDDIETTELGIAFRVGALVMGLVSFWLGLNPSVLVGSGVNRGAGLVAVIQSGAIGQLAVGVVMLAFALLMVAISYTGRVPKEGSNTNRDMLP